MPTWGDILNELNRTTNPAGVPDFDVVRRKYLRQLNELTGRGVILYATAWFETRPTHPLELQIGLPDMQGLMEVVSDLRERELDIILHSPGGSADAAESMVEFLRERFGHVRVFVPIAAMSAATMVALSANELVMGQHSQLGPIDPQFIISTPEGERSAPAKAILKQFEQAKSECTNPANLAAWMPILRTYSPGLLTQCEQSQKLAADMVAGWMQRYMFSGEEDAAKKSTKIAEWFADYDSFRSHGRRIGRAKARERGVKVVDLEDDDRLQDAVLSVHHATMHTFSGAPAYKIIENHNGRSWIRSGGSLNIPIPAVPVPVPPPPQDEPAPNRSERRRQERRSKKGR